MKLLYPLFFLLFSVLMFTCTETIYAQNEITSTDLRNLTTSNVVNTRQYTETTGSPYPIEEFKNGLMIFVNGKASKVMPIRFNAHQHTLEFKEDDTTFIIDPKEIKEFEIYYDDSVHKFRKGFDASRLSEDQFVRLLIDDEVKYILSHSANLQRNISTYGSATRKDRFVDDINYYIKIGDGDLNRIRRFRKRHVMRNIDSHQDEVDKFVQNNNTDFSDPVDVEELFLYYNSLLVESYYE